MGNSQNKKRLQIVLLVLIAVATLGIGYASITAVNLMINGNATGTVAQENFKVYFVPTSDTPSLTGNVTLTGSATIDSEDNTVAHFNVSGLSKEGDYAIATYTIINNSEAIGAEITLNLTNSNSEYFKVTETVSDTQLQAGDTTTGTIKVEMIKTPIENDVSTSVTGTLTASPMDNASATGREEKEVIKPTSYVYTFHKWGDTNIYINVGEPFPSSERIYNNFSAMKMELGYPAGIAHILENDRIIESYVVFEMNNKLYYLRGGAGDESGQETKQIYFHNVNMLKEAFGPDWQSVCREYENYQGNNYDYFSCCNGGSCARVRTTGIVGEDGPNWNCNVFEDGRAHCEGW